MSEEIEVDYTEEIKEVREESEALQIVEEVKAKASSLEIHQPQLYSSLKTLVDSKKITSCKKVEEAYMKYALAEALGLDPVVNVCTNGIYFIGGLPALDAATLMTLLRTHGHDFLIEDVEGSQKEGYNCTAYIIRKNEKFKDDKGLPIVRKYTLTWEDVKLAEWDKNTMWKKIPKIMMGYRTLALCVRKHVPEVTKGFKQVDELDGRYGYNEEGQLIS